MNILTNCLSFHWIIAILIITNVVLGVWFVGVMAPKDAMRRMVVEHIFWQAPTDMVTTVALPRNFES